MIVNDTQIFRALFRRHISLLARTSLPSFPSVQNAFAAERIVSAWCRQNLGTEANEVNEDLGVD
jgi:hypothetical protein